jgi:hypothetical protein
MRVAILGQESFQPRAAFAQMAVRPPELPQRRCQAQPDVGVGPGLESVLHR